MKIENNVTCKRREKIDVQGERGVWNSVNRDMYREQFEDSVASDEGTSGKTGRIPVALRNDIGLDNTSQVWLASKRGLEGGRSRAPNGDAHVIIPHRNARSPQPCRSALDNAYTKDLLQMLPETAQGISFLLIEKTKILAMITSKNGFFNNETKEWHEICDAHTFVVVLYPRLQQKKSVNTSFSSRKKEGGPQITLLSWEEHELEARQVTDQRGRRRTPCYVLTSSNQSWTRVLLLLPAKLLCSCHFFSSIFGFPCLRSPTSERRLEV